MQSVEAMRRKYGLTTEAAPPIALDRSQVPRSLWPLIPYACVWGIADDLMRSDFAARVSPSALADLRNAIAPFEDVLDSWLAGPDAMKLCSTPEYVAFSCMRMAADGV